MLKKKRCIASINYLVPAAPKTAIFVGHNLNNSHQVDYENHPPLLEPNAESAHYEMLDKSKQADDHHIYTHVSGAGERRL